MEAIAAAKSGDAEEARKSFKTLLKNCQKPIIIRQS